MSVARPALLAAALAFGGCGAKPPDPAPVPRPEEPRVRTTAPATDEAPSAQPEVVLEPERGAAVRVRVEVARTEPARRRGLMFRRHMDPDAGMLFVFDAPERQSFWMRNTFIPLDMIFIDADHRVVGVVEDATPLTEDERAVEAESQYVLEVHAGFAREHGLAAGTLVRFVNIPED